MNKNNLLMLGGSPFQVPCFKYAKSKGYHVISCDYCPDNPGHQYADEYVNVSTTDLEAVLQLAKEKNIDGVLAYASDPAAPTAAYVAEKLNLPGNPYESVVILSEKDKYRKFQHQHNFNSPRYDSFCNLENYLKQAGNFTYPVIIKPVDSSGSKGVTKVTEACQIPKAVEFALSFSRANRFIVEEFIERKYTQLDGDIFVYDGKIVAYYLGDQIRNVKVNEFTPVGSKFPSRIPQKYHDIIFSELQRMIDLLNLKFGGMNIEVLISTDDKVYIIEAGARNGGNCIPEIIKYASNVDMVKMSVETCLGNRFDLSNRKEIDKFYITYVIHSNRDGIFKNVKVSHEVNDYILDMKVIVNEGDEVQRFTGSNCTLGIALLEFPTEEIFDDMVERLPQLIKAELE